MFNRIILSGEKAAIKSQPFAWAAKLTAAGISLFVVLVFLAGCGDSPGTTVSTVPPMSSGSSTSSGSMTSNSRAKVVFHTATGDSILKVEVARTGAEKEKGLMGVSSLDTDSGMIFVWDSPVTTPFWMKDTLIPLSIAFLSGDGTVLDIQEMEAQTLNLHAPGKAYFYAVEANKGYFSRHGITSGDKAEIIF